MVEAKQKPAGYFSFDVNDSRSVISHEMSKDLSLRVIKEDSGWIVQVARQPVSRNSSWNLLYHSLKWHGSYPSEVYPWHVAEKYFPNERKLEVRGYPYEVKIVLIDPMIEGQGSEAKFVSGRIEVFWRRKP